MVHYALTYHHDSVDDLTPLVAIFRYGDHQKALSVEWRPADEEGHHHRHWQQKRLTQSDVTSLVRATRATYTA